MMTRKLFFFLRRQLFHAGYLIEVETLLADERQLLISLTTALALWRLWLDNQCHFGRVTGFDRQRYVLVLSYLTAQEHRRGHFDLSSTGVM